MELRDATRSVFVEGVLFVLGVLGWMMFPLSLVFTLSGYKRTYAMVSYVREWS